MNEAIELAGQPPPMVPQSYAEKAMASLMQLHSDLMEEKERRVDLYRRLMEKEQQLAELKMYVKMLEERGAPKAEVAAPPPPAPVQAVTPPPPPPILVRRACPRCAAPAGDASAAAADGEAERVGEWNA
ncbi:MAG: hypothetical protein QM723_05495 [Myxococcaceae bacterium]